MRQKVGVSECGQETDCSAAIAPAAARCARMGRARPRLSAAGVRVPGTAASKDVNAPARFARRREADFSLEPGVATAKAWRSSAATPAPRGRRQYGSKGETDFGTEVT
jgi:hypothetical protein